VLWQRDGRIVIGRHGWCCHIKQMPRCVLLDTLWRRLNVQKITKELVTRCFLDFIMAFEWFKHLPNWLTLLNLLNAAVALAALFLTYHKEPKHERKHAENQERQSALQADHTRLQYLAVGRAAQQSGDDMKGSQWAPWRKMAQEEHEKAGPGAGPSWLEEVGRTDVGANSGEEDAGEEAVAAVAPPPPPTTPPPPPPTHEQPAPADEVAAVEGSGAPETPRTSIGPNEMRVGTPGTHGRTRRLPESPTRSLRRVAGQHQPRPSLEAVVVQRLWGEETP
jgi:hypothetical protein